MCMWRETGEGEGDLQKPLVQFVIRKPRRRRRRRRRRAGSISKKRRREEAASTKVEGEEKGGKRG